ncbi:hypothetical protein [Deinococcus arenicola]|uniref:Uncharacterized protein n=1 Tax=Deinococcus arenicola TaxID=2994950 RepID=A0ABU4DME7_9DEIO|nr:hypothetical protein [Deinococcus sp. ZS9-10]MDV6373605.1 hypothetical protein [Deinococcus sp. ZS9-10]
MFGKRRVPPHLVLTFSLLLGVLCGVWAFFAARSESWVWAVLAGVLAVWFIVDTVRSYGWNQNKKRLEAEKQKQSAAR